MQPLYQFILLGHLCWAVDYHEGQLNQKCGQIYEQENSRHTSLESCVERAEYLGTGLMLNRKNKGSYVTEMTINCIPTAPVKGQLPFYNSLKTYQIIWQ